MKIKVKLINKSNKELAVSMLKVNGKKIIMINITIMSVLALLTVCCYKLASMNAALPVISSFSLLTFDITSKNTLSQNKPGIILNILLYSIAFLAVYHMILLIFSIDSDTIAKLLLIQIFLEIYSIARFFTNNLKLINKVIFYTLFFAILASACVYEFYRKLNIIEIILFSSSIASVVSALYIVFISSCRKNYNL